MSLAPLIRVWRGFNPPEVEKRSDALRFGVLGAAAAAGMTLIIPAKMHPEVVVQAVAARDRRRAEDFAKKNGIPEVKDSYQDILDDPNIDCVFIPLPNAFHFEWAVRAIRAGKHVLLEKPSVANAAEAEALFTLPELDGPRAPVLMEVFQFRFHPAWAVFRSLLTPAAIEHVDAYSMIPWWLSGGMDNVHFNYALAGGSMIGIGTYTLAALRGIFAAEPVECLGCDVKAFTEGVHRGCDYESTSRFRFPNGGVGQATSTLRGPTIWHLSYATVTHRQVAVPDKALPGSQEKLVRRVVKMTGMLHANVWHRIDVKDEFEIRDRDDGRVVRAWTESWSRKAYTPQEAGGELASLKGEDYWMSYMYQMEQFVNGVRGRETQYWVDRDDSISQMKMIDMAYEKSGLGVRPGRKYIVD